jgi:hypothetical protein
MSDTFDQGILEAVRSERDNASLAFETLSREWMPIWSYALWTKSPPPVLRGISCTLGDMAASRDVSIENILFDCESVTESLDLGTHLAYEENTWIDEPLPRLPLRTQRIKVKLRMRGRGEPRLGFEREIDLRDDV